MWGKKNIDEDEKTTEKVTGEKQGDLGGWLADDSINGGECMNIREYYIFYFILLYLI